MQSWLSAPLGRAVLAAETELVAETLEDVFGWELLQIGSWGPERGLVGASRTRRTTVAASGVARAGVDVIAQLPQLPIASATLDAVLLPHTLEFEAEPKAVIREVDRVLAGEGQLIVMGFQPWSLWGARARVSRGGFPPGLRRMLPERRLRDWLGLLGYEIVSSRAYLYRRPWGSPEVGPETATHLLRRGLAPMPAGAYLLKARKRMYTATPIKPRMRERTAVIGQLVKPTTRSSS